MYLLHVNQGELYVSSLLARPINIVCKHCSSLLVNQTKELVKVLGGQRYICGYHPDTLKSLMLTLLPNTVDGFRHTSEDVAVDSIEVYFMETLFRALNDAGFNWPHVSLILYGHIHLKWAHILYYYAISIG